MAKFSAVKTRARTKTINKAGGVAYKQTDKLEFVSTLLTSFLNDKFYESGQETQQRLVNLIAGLPDKLFVAKAAVYARTVFGMRSVSHLTAGEIAALVKGEPWTKNFFDKVVYRVDDITEILAYYMSNYGKPIPNALKKGLGLALGRFDQYAISKYRGESHNLSLVDVVNLIHPKPTDVNKKALKLLVEDKLRSKDTWETELSKAGQSAETEEEKEELKKEAWIDLIKEKKIKYFALLRNLRNIIEQAPEVLDEALEMLTDKDLIKKSLVLPFRYDTARIEIEQLTGKEARKTLIALNKAIDIACKNVPVFDGETLVVLDCSGSMDGKPGDIGALFSAVLAKSNNADFMMFSDDADYHDLNVSDSILTITQSIKDNFQSAGTNFPAIFNAINKKYDRIIILSDMQGWMEGGAPTHEFNQYKKKYNADPYIYSFDLNSYGTMMFPENKVYCIAGFSEKVFDIMKLMETDKQALIHEIERIEL